MKLAVTGATGLIGWHICAHLHAANCAARFQGHDAPYDWIALDRRAFADDTVLGQAADGADAALHFAGVNRGSDEVVEAANPAIAARLAKACRTTGSHPHIIYANSVHAGADTPYGRSKGRAGDVLSGISDRYTNLILPHIVGECARPNYNNVTATFIDAVIQGNTPDINPDGWVSLLHAGAVAQIALDAVHRAKTGDLSPPGRDISVGDLFTFLQDLHATYQANIFPDLGDPFALAMFNSYRAVHCSKPSKAVEGSRFSCQKRPPGSPVAIIFT